jgi:molybdenum-dependent DNA-binding transcriptional regulator ModE
MGRGIRRLVTLYDSLEDLIDEADEQLQDDSEVEEFADDETYERKRE